MAQQPEQSGHTLSGPSSSGAGGARGRVVSVNVGGRRVFQWYGRPVVTAIWKEPVGGAVALRGVNLAGDDQADRRVHGGDEKAVYAYASEDYAWWSGQLGEPLGPGTFGENLTLAGIDLHACAVGETWRVGTTRLRVSQPRFPCFKLGVRMRDNEFVDRFAAARRFGAYFSVVEEGEVAADDEAVLLDRPDDVITIAEFIRGSEERDVEVLGRLVSHPHVGPTWREHAARALRRITGNAGDAAPPR